jgi:hypothetical protein
LKKQKSGAEAEAKVPLDVFADLHKKNPVIFGTKITGFLHKNGKRALSIMPMRELFCFFRD